VETEVKYNNVTENSIPDYLLVSVYITVFHIVSWNLPEKGHSCHT